MPSSYVATMSGPVKSVFGRRRSLTVVHALGEVVGATDDVVDARPGLPTTRTASGRSAGRASRWPAMPRVVGEGAFEVLGRHGALASPLMEKLVYLGVGAAVASSGRRARRSSSTTLRPGLLALGAHGLQIDLDDDDAADVASMVPVPGDELPVRACVSVWLDAHDTRAPYEDVLADAGVRRAGYLVTESMYCDYGGKQHSGPRLARRHALARHHHVDRVRQARRRRRRDVLRPLVRAPVADVGVRCSRALATCATRSCAALTPGAPRYRAIVEEAWPTVEHLTDLATFFGATDGRRAGREHPHHARQHEVAVRPRDDAQLHDERIHPEELAIAECISVAAVDGKDPHVALGNHRQRDRIRLAAHDPGTARQVEFPAADTCDRVPGFQQDGATPPVVRRDHRCAGARSIRSELRASSVMRSRLHRSRPGIRRSAAAYEVM